MPFFDKNIEAVEEADLQWLVDTQYSEASIIEYKAQLNFTSNDEMEKVLRQVSSFANARGGNLIYGIQVSNTDKGVPERLEGQPSADADGFIQKVENVIRTGIRPQLSSFETRPIKLANGNYAFVFRIQQSWSRPHQLRFNNKYLFYTRSSNGLAHIDVEDLRNLFVGSEELRKRVESFRLSRISDLVGGVSPAGKIEPPIVVLHFVPLTEFAKGELHDPIVYSHNIDALAPISRVVFNTQFNFEGYLATSNGEVGFDFYLQGFRDLSLEVVWGEYSHTSKNGKKMIRQTSLSEELFLMLANALKFYKSRNVGVPIVGMLGIFGAKGLKFAPSQRLYGTRENPIDRDVLQFPPFLITDYLQDEKDLLKPTLDMFWQAAGFRRCFDYSESGKWINA